MPSKSDARILLEEARQIAERFEDEFIRESLNEEEQAVLVRALYELTHQLEQAREALKEALPYVGFSNKEGSRRAEVARMIESAQPEEERRGTG